MTPYLTRIARAMLSDPDGEPENLERMQLLVRKVLEAASEPDEAMIEAGGKEHAGSDRFGPGPEDKQENAAEIFRAMIKQALEGK